MLYIILSAIAIASVVYAVLLTDSSIPQHGV